MQPNVTATSNLMIRPVGTSEIADLIELQRQALPGSLPSRLGTGFLRLYYESLIPQPDFLCDAFFLDSRMLGFIAYSPNSQDVLKKAMNTRLGAYLGVVAKSLLRNPRRLPMVLAIVPSTLALSREPGHDIRSEMISIGVLPRYRGSSASSTAGRHVAADLMRHALSVLQARGVERVKLYTRLERDDPAANKFVQKHGFSLVKTVRHYGQVANLYIGEFRP